MTKNRQKSHYHLLKQKWLRRHHAAKKAFHKKHKDALEWIAKKFPTKESLASSAIGVLMLSSVIPASTVLGEIGEISKLKESQQVAPVDKTQALLDELAQVFPEQMRPLNREEEIKISQILSRYFGANVNFEADGKKLNRSYGLIGAEQHLMRYPGDTMATHLDPQVTKNKFFYSSGMAPGRGAWGYFANSKSEFTPNDEQREMWYIAAPTFAIPDYEKRVAEYRDFFKYRKMLVVNPKTGKGVVTDIADAGPATFTGKHLGGSPEVMYYLGLHEGPRKGAVLYFFIIDPDDKIPLGPIAAI